MYQIVKVFEKSPFTKKADAFSKKAIKITSIHAWFMPSSKVIFYGYETQ